MKKETKVLLFLVLHCTIMVVSMFLCGYWLVSSAPDTTDALSLLTKFKYLIAIVALLLGIVYFTVGYKKNAYMYYRAYMAMFGLDVMASIISAMSYQNISILSAIATLLLFTCVAFLTIAKDLGKERSYTLGISAVVFALIIFVCMWLDKGFIDIDLAYINLSNIMLSITTLLMIIGKYIDKKLRGAE